MKKIVFLAFALLTATLPNKKLRAQAAAYDRPAVNFLLVTHGDAYDAPTAAFFGKIPKEDKFYVNDLTTKELKVSQLSRNTLSPTAWQQV